MRTFRDYLNAKYADVLKKYGPSPVRQGYTTEQIEKALASGVSQPGQG
jgi:hypothetical protein